MQSIANQQGRGFIELDVAGGLAPTQVVIVHAGQIVVDKAVGMKRFDSGSGRHGICRGDAVQGSAFQHKKGSKPFATLQRVAHGAHHRDIGPVPKCGIKRLLHRSLGGLQPFGEHLRALRPSSCRRAHPPHSG